MDYVDYRLRLGLGFSDKDKQNLFISRIQIFLQAQSGIPFDTQQETEFCYQIGEKCLLENKPLIDWDIINGEPTGLQRVWLYLRNKSFDQVLLYIVVFANTYTGAKKNKKMIIGAIERALKDSHIQYEVVQDSDGIFFMPKGAKELDSALVSQPLQWLAKYPQSYAAFLKALKEYANVTPDNASDVADKFRKALETFFQEFFGSNKSLDNCKSLYGTYLKSQNVPKEIAGNLETLLLSYTIFMNTYAKHHDRTSINILEYIMYQTGNIIRLLITLKQAEYKEKEIITGDSQ